MIEVLTEEQKEKDFKAIYAIKDKNEKLSWTRRQKNLEELIATEINPLAEQILALQMQQQDLIDKAMEAREKMVKECIHPKGSLVHFNTHILCKFCNRKLSRPKTK
ncbi:hypothetical protein [Stenotrophomonas phage RAS14]